MGGGVGIFSIRDGSKFVTVNNSNFYIENNGGSSALVLAGVNNCTFNNNTVTGVGNVGNLIYLTTYNVAGVSEDDININSQNNITNNVVTGPEEGSIFCYGITLTGHDNLIENNTVNVTGQGITTQMGYIDPSDPESGTNSDRYKGNYYINNTVLRNGSFKATNNSTISKNNISGSLATGANSTANNNLVNSWVEVYEGAVVVDNIIRSIVKVSGSNSIIEHNTIHGSVRTTIFTKNTTIENNNLCNGIEDLSGHVTNVNNTCDGTCNCGVTSCICGCKNSKTGEILFSENEEYEEVVLTDENFNSYFSITSDPWGDGGDTATALKNVTGKLLILDSTITHVLNQVKYIEFGDYGNCIVSGGVNGYVFTNKRILTSNSPIKFTNMTFRYDDTRNFPKNDITPVLISAWGNATFENITVSVRSTTLDPIYSHLAFIRTNSRAVSTVFKNSNFTFDVSSVTPSGIIGEGKNLQIINCTLTMNDITNTSNSTDLKLLSIYGNDNLIENNTITFSGNPYLYAVYSEQSNNNTIRGNNITVTGITNATAIYLKQGLNNTVKNNNINVVNGTGVQYVSQERNTTVADNIIITDDEFTVYVDDSSTGAVVENNTLIASSLTGDDSVSADRTNNIVRNNNNGLSTLLVVDVDETVDVLVGDDVAINLTLTDASGNPISGNVVLTIGNFIDTVAIDTTGRATYTYTTTASGSLTISAKYEGEGNYLASESNTVDVEVSKITPEITVEVADNNIAIVTRDTVINGTLVDSEGNAISGATINVYIINVLIGTNTTDSEGKYTYTYVPATVGENIPVNVTFAGDDKYYAAVQTSWVDVEKIGTVLTVDSIDNTIINNTVVVTGSLTEEYTGTVVSDATIKVTVGNAVYTNTTDSEGKYTIIVDGQSVAGTYDIIISYEGTDTLNEVDAETSYDVNVLTTTTTVEPVDVTLNETATLIATVIDENNANVNGGTVTFTINDTVIGTADVIDGVATMNVTALKAWNNTNISASYNGMADVYQDSLSENNTVTIGLRSPTVTLISDKLSGKKGDTITFIAQITDGDTLVNQGYVSFKLNGITLIDANTGERNHIKVINGIAQFEYTLPSYSGKDYNITVVYAGTDYTRTEDTGVLTIIKTNTYMNGNILSISPNGTATLNVKVFDEDNNLLDRDVKVSIKVNGITMLKEVTVVNGSTNFDLTLLPSSKPYNITIITGENSNYMGSNTTVICHNTLPKINTTIDTTTSTTGDVTTVNVNVKDVYGNAVSTNPKVSIKVDGKTVISGQTAVNGVYTGNITTPTSGSHKLLVIAGETDSYASSRNETTITF